MSIALQAALALFAELMKAFNEGRLTQKIADDAVSAAIAKLHPVGDPS